MSPILWREGVGGRFLNLISRSNRSLERNFVTYFWKRLRSQLFKIVNQIAPRATVRLIWFFEENSWVKKISKKGYSIYVTVWVSMWSKSPRLFWKDMYVAYFMVSLEKNFPVLHNRNTYKFVKLIYRTQKRIHIEMSS